MKTLVLKKQFTEKFLPSPFNTGNSPEPQAGVVEITNSTLVCEECWDVVSSGVYYEEKRLLVFTCISGHKNEVKVEL